MSTVHVRKGDVVQVIGGKFRGKRGKILRVDRDRSRVIVEGVNLVKRHMKPSQKMPQGGIVEKEAPMASAKVMIVCGSCGEPNRVGHRVLPDGTKARYCKNCGEIIETKK